MTSTGSSTAPVWREPARVMRLSRLGSLHQCRLSFMRVLTRRMAREGWRFSRPLFDIDGTGVGRAVYAVERGDRVYSLVAFAHDLPDALRSDRVIAEAWDATFALFDGVPTRADLDRLAETVPLQEAGRLSERELVLSRANRSGRLWRHVVEALASGRQPDNDTVGRVGYLMRTTAVYASGKFGTADRDRIRDRPELKAPFQAEMLTVYLIRTFVRDLVNHMGRAAGGDGAVPLDPALARRLGIGNSTGLGMAPFIVNHPVLFNNWIAAREAAIASVRAVERATNGELALFRDLLGRCHIHVARWRSDNPVQTRKLAGLRRDLDVLTGYAEADLTPDHLPWDRLMCWSESALGDEGQELIASLILEPYADRVDALVDTMSDDAVDSGLIDGRVPVGTLRRQIGETFGWALAIDWTRRRNQARVWYVSEEKLEPRLGERFEEPVAAYEQPLGPARDAVRAHGDLSRWPDDAPVARFLLAHPEHRHVVRRFQMCRRAPYGEIRDNTIGADLMPIDMLRSKLAFFGATHFDPRSDRWVRISMYAGAPHPEALTVSNADRWIYPDPDGPVASVGT